MRRVRVVKWDSEESGVGSREPGAGSQESGLFSVLFAAEQSFQKMCWQKLIEKNEVEKKYEARHPLPPEVGQGG